MNMANKKETFDNIKYINQLRNEPNAPNSIKSLPVATNKNVADVASGFLSNPDARVFYWQFLIDRIGLTEFKTVRFENPLDRVRKADVKLGHTIQEIFIQLCEEKQYDINSGAELLATELPNVDAVYYMMNRDSKYEQSILDSAMQRYFVSWEQLNDFTSSVIEAIRTSDNNDEYNYCKQALSVYADKGLYYKVHIDPIVDDVTGSKAIQLMQKYALDMGFVKDIYNARRNMTATPYDDLILFCTIDFDTSLSVFTQAKVFNLEKAEYLSNRIIIDNFGDNNIQAILCSEKFLNIRNYLYENHAWFNPDNLSTKYYLHHWEWIYTSQLENAICFTTDPVEADGITSITLSPATATLSIGAQMLFNATVVYTGNATKNLTWTCSGQTSANTMVNERSGMVFIGADETAKTITITATSDFDKTKTGTATITIAENQGA